MGDILIIFWSLVLKMIIFKIVDKRKGYSNSDGCFQLSYFPQDMVIKLVW